MQYFVIDVDWSVTDRDTHIVYAESKEKAIEILKKATMNLPRYYTVIRTCECVVANQDEDRERAEA